jgi:hypothetical protein
MNFNVIFNGEKYLLHTVDGFKGGAIVGEGGQGCVIGPEIYTKDPNFVTKIAKRADAEGDFAISSALFKLDPSERYGVYYRGRKNCRVTPKDLESEHIVANPDGRRCSQIAHRIKTETFCALKMPRFQSDLHGHLPEIDKPNFEKFVKAIWECVAFLHRHDYVHGDIKTENIALYDGRPVLFDWGWAFHIKKAKTLNKAFDEFSSDDYWTPLLRQVPVRHPIKALVLFNDVYMMAKAVREILLLAKKKYGNNSFSVLLSKHQEIIDNQEKFCEIPINDIIQFLFS